MPRGWKQGRLVAHLIGQNLLLTLQLLQALHELVDEALLLLLQLVLLQGGKGQQLNKIVLLLQAGLLMWLRAGAGHPPQ